MLKPVNLTCTCFSHSKVNGLCICFRQVDIGGRNTPSPKHTRRATLTPTSSPTPPQGRQQRGGSLKIGDVSKHLAGVTLNDQGPPSFQRGSGIPLRRSVSPLASHSKTSPSPSPQPPSSPPHGEVATFNPIPPLTSSPPPPPPESTDDDTGDNTEGLLLSATVQ